MSRRRSTAVLMLLFVATHATAGTVTVSCTLTPFSTGQFTSHGYVSYTSIFGNQTAESVAVTHQINGTSASKTYNCTTPCSDTLVSDERGVPPNCYSAMINGLADDSSDTKSSEQVCLQGPPPPPPPGKDDGLITACENGCVDPLVLDLNGDGIQTTGADKPVSFDINGDGRKDLMGWTNPRTMEGFLWIDLHHDGKVDDGSELFGIGTTLPDGTKATDGFQALAVYDDPNHGGNGDGMISSADRVWNQLRVWIDRNHNGVCDPGETASIREYGIEEILLAAASMNYVDSAGNIHQRHSLFRRRVVSEHERGESSDWFGIESIAFKRAK